MSEARAILIVVTMLTAGCAAAPSADSSSRPARPAAAAPAPAAPATAAPASVHLGRLQGARHEPGEGERNPFRFQPKPAPAAARPAVVVAPPAEMARPTPVAPAGPPPLPPIPLKFIGLVQKADGVKWAVVSDGKLTSYGRQGDTVGGQYRIVAIGTESIELAYADGRGRQTVRLTGQ